MTNTLTTIGAFEPFPVKVTLAAYVVAPKLRPSTETVTVPEVPPLAGVTLNQGWLLAADQFILPEPVLDTVIV